MQEGGYSEPGESPGNQVWKKKAKAYLLRPVDALSLAMFRFLFGMVMAYYALVLMAPEHLEEIYIKPAFLMPFSLLDFLHMKPFKPHWIFWTFKAMGISAFLFGVGLFYRAALGVFLLSFGGIFLIEHSYFNNHYYLILLVAFLMLFMGANRSFSLDAVIWPRLHTRRVSMWNIFILRMQICVLYFFGGVAKLNADWLAGHQISMWKGNWKNYPVLGQLLHYDWTVFFFSYGGLVFDLTIGFFLLWKRSRPFAIPFVLFFHLMNLWLFHIGIFHYFMLATILLFLEPDTPRRFLRKVLSFGKRWNRPFAAPNLTPDSDATREKQAQIVYWFVCGYLFIQVAIPLRHFFLHSNVNWSYEGDRFAWRILPTVRKGSLTITATDKENSFSWQLYADDKSVYVKQDFSDPKLRKTFAKNPFFEKDVYRITSKQGYEIMTRPSSTLQYIHYLRDELKKTGIAEPLIYADARISVNGRAYYSLIDPTVNLADQEYYIMSHNRWILPHPELK